MNYMPSVHECGNMDAINTGDACGSGLFYPIKFDISLICGKFVIESCDEYSVIKYCPYCGVELVEGK